MGEIRSSKQIVGNKQMDGEGMKLSCTLHFKDSKIYIDILKKEFSNKSWLYTGMDTQFELEWQKSKDKEDAVVLKYKTFNVLDLSTLFFFSELDNALKALFKLSRVELCRNVLKGNENYFKLAGGSSLYQG